MKRYLYTRVLILSGFLSFNGILAQDYDILIRGGHVIDPKNKIDQVKDVAILDGKVAMVADDIPQTQAKLVIDATGLYLCPGLIDIHSHNFYGTEEDAYLSNGFTALPPDGFTFRNGVTTVVDAGGAGWRNFRMFREQTIDRSETRVLAFLNIAGTGMKGGAPEQDVSDMDARLTAMVARQYPDLIVGIKLAHFEGPDWVPVERAVEAGKLAQIPVMIDFGRSEPPLSIETLLMEKLRPGDIFTHMYAHVERRLALVNESGKLEPYALNAQKRGILFDVGHGGGSFVFRQAVPALAQGLYPNTISTDLHIESMNTGMKDLSNVMSKFLNLDLPIQEVIRCATWNAAQAIHRPDLGHLSEGAGADLAIFRVHEGSFGFTDTEGMKMNGSRKLECELTLREGRVVWDLNGLSKTMWNEK